MWNDHIEEAHKDEEVLRLHGGRDSAFPAPQLSPTFQSFLHDAIYVSKQPQLF